MVNYKFSYDSEHDDLFVYTDEKSKGSVEMGNFVFDFNQDGKLVALEVLNASKTFAKLMEHSIRALKSLKSCQIDAANMRNMIMIKISLFYENGEITTTLFAPRVTETSPALEY